MVNLPFVKKALGLSLRRWGCSLNYLCSETSLRWIQKSFPFFPLPLWKRVGVRANAPSGNTLRQRVKPINSWTSRKIATEDTEFTELEVLTLHFSLFKIAKGVKEN